MNKNRAMSIGLAMLLLSSIVGCSTQPVTAPTGYKEWNAKDATFRIDYPNDWSAEGDGRHGVQWATFEKGSASINVSVSFGDSVQGDILGSAGGMGLGMSGAEDVEDDLPEPVAILHQSKMKAFAEDYSDYQEKEAIEIKPPLGPGRKSEFSGSKAFSKVRGYRALMLSNDRGVTVICQCNESDWSVLKPAFDKILDGITLGMASR